VNIGKKSQKIMIKTMKRYKRYILKTNASYWQMTITMEIKNTMIYMIGFFI